MSSRDTLLPGRLAWRTMASVTRSEKVVNATGGRRVKRSPRIVKPQGTVRTLRGSSGNGCSGRHPGSASRGWSAFPVQVHYHPVTDTLQAKEVWGGSRPSTPMGFGTAGSASATVPSGSASMWSCANLTALATSGGADTRWASMRSRGARARCTGAVSSSTRTAGATKEECLDGEAHGQGVSVAPDGQRYEGGFRDGQPHGHGVGTTPDGGGYEGQWRYGQPHGKGVVTYPDGQRCEGEWRNGKRHGPA